MSVVGALAIGVIMGAIIMLVGVCAGEAWRK